MTVEIRQKIERTIAERFVDDALKAGYRLAVSLERGYDIDEMLLGSRDRDKILEAMFAGDECHVFVQPAEGPTVEDGRVISEGFVYFVLGNDGWDVISDYSTRLERLLTSANKLAEQIENGEFKIVVT